MWRTRSITGPKGLSIFWKFLQLERGGSFKKQLELGQEVLSWNVRTWQFGQELFEFPKYGQFQLFSGISELQNIGSNSLKKSELNEPLVWVISKTKEPALFMKEPMVGYLIFNFWEPWLWIECPFNGGEMFARVSVWFF